MRRDKKKLDELEELLFRSHRSKDSVEAGDAWRASVMEEIRALGYAETGKSEERAWTNRFVWRFSIAAGLVAILLLAYTLSTGFIDYSELAMMFIEEPAEFFM